MPIIEHIVAFCCRHARAVVLVLLLAMVAGAAYTAANFAMNTDSSTLISPNLPWRKTMARFDGLFPQRNNLILVVIDAASADRANTAANQLSAKLSADPKQFPAVRRPDGGPYFEKNGLLFLPEKCVKDAMEKLVQAQPFLGALASDPSLRGVMDSLSTALLGVSSGQAKLAELDAPLDAFKGTLAKTNAGKSDYLSWRELFAEGDTNQKECSFARTRTFIEVQPKLDYAALTPGDTAETKIRETAKQLGLTPDHGVRVRLTGPVPLSDEEFATIAENGPLMGLAMFLAVTLCLFLAVRSIRIILCILVTLAAGLILTTAIGLAVAIPAVIAFNIFNKKVGLVLDNIDAARDLCLAYTKSRRA